MGSTWIRIRKTLLSTRESKQTVLSASCWYLAMIIVQAWLWRRHISLKCWLTFNGLHRLIYQNKELFHDHCYGNFQVLHTILFYCSNGVRLSSLVTETTVWPTETGVIKISKGNRRTQRKPTPVPLWPPQILHDLTRARTWADTVGSRRLTAWAMTRSFTLYQWVTSHYSCICSRLQSHIKWTSWIVSQLLSRNLLYIKSGTFLQEQSRSHTTATTAQYMWLRKQQPNSHKTRTKPIKSCARPKNLH
jgi:hypothetical protein